MIRNSASWSQISNSNSFKLEEPDGVALIHDKGDPYTWRGTVEFDLNFLAGQGALQVIHDELVITWFCYLRLVLSLGLLFPVVCTERKRNVHAALVVIGPFRIEPQDEVLGVVHTGIVFFAAILP